MSSDAPTLIVFVCEHGAARSQIAAALFNGMAARFGLPNRAISRGTDPDAEVPPVVRDGLRADGLDIGDVRPIELKVGDDSRADLFVCFDVEVPDRVAGGAPVHRWDGMPSVMENYAAGRDAIASRVAMLIDAALNATVG